MKRIVFSLLILITTPLLGQLVPGEPYSAFNPNDMGYTNAAISTSDGFDNGVLDFDTLSNGKIIVVGSFQKFNGISAKRIVLLTREGHIDTLFNYNMTGANSDIKSVEVLPNDSIIIAGAFTQYNGIAVNGIALIGANGQINTTFVANANLAPFANTLNVARDSNGNYFIATKPDVATSKIYKLSATGINDTVFSNNIGSGFVGNSTTNTIRKLYIDNNNRIIVCGLFSGFNGASSPRCILRLNNDGTRDNTFTETVGAFPVTVSSSNAGIFDIKPYGTNKYVVAGCFDNYGALNNFANGLIIINEDGHRDNTFQDWVYYGDTLLRVSAVEVLSDNRIVACTQLFRNPPINEPYRILVFNPNGTLSNITFQNISYGPIGLGTLPFTNAMLRDNNIIVSGYMGGYNNTPRAGLAMFSASGNLSPFVFAYSGADQLVTRMVTYPDNDTISTNNSLIVAGSFYRYNNGDFNRIVKIKPDGQIDSTFNPGSGFSNFIREIQIDSTGKIFAGGNFTTFDGLSCNRIIRLNSNGTRDNTFNIGTGFNGSVSDIRLLPGGKLIVTGNFTTYKGTTCNRVVKLLYNGNIDPSLMPVAVLMLHLKQYN